MYAAMSRWLRRSSYAPSTRRDRPALAQGVDHVERIDPGPRGRRGHLDHHVQLGGAVVDDAEADAAVVQAGGDVQVGRRGLQTAARMVVQHHLAPVRATPGSASTMSAVPRATARAAMIDAVASTVPTKQTSRPPAAAISAARYARPAG